MNGRTGMSNLPRNDSLYRMDMNLLGANTNVQIHVEEENKRAKSQEKEYSNKGTKHTDYGGFKTPKMEIPKIPKPKF